MKKADAEVHVFVGHQLSDVLAQALDWVKELEARPDDLDDDIACSVRAYYGNAVQIACSSYEMHWKCVLTVNT